MTGAEGGRSPAGRCRGRLEGAIAALREHTLNWPESPPGAPVSSARDVCKRWEQWLERRERLLNVLAECPWDGPEGKGDSILDAFHALLEAEERLEELGTVARLVEELGRGGLAAAGPEPVTAAAVEGRIDILLVLDGLRLTGYECSSCGALMTPEATDGQCIYCGARVDPIDLTEALIKVAESQGATVEIVANDERLEKLGGVGALLRF